MPATTITHLLVDTADVTRLLEENRGHGRWARNYVTVAAGVPFRLFTAGASELAVAAQLQVRATHTGYCEPDLDVAKDDIIVLHSDNPLRDARTYRVTAVMDPSLYHHRKVLMEVYERAEYAS